MNVHWIQHVPFEGLGCMERWLAERGHAVSCSRLFAGDPLPAAAAVEGLIVMGGPMGAGDEAVYPWLAAEKALLGAVMAQDKPVLGICLGAQLMAAALGAPVTRNRHREIGFFPVRGDGTVLPKRFTALHWHGDTFALPPGAVHLASSEGCAHQAFLYRRRALGLQFHLETTAESLRALQEHGGEEPPGPFVQTPEEMARFVPELPVAQELMFGLLRRLF